MGKSFDKRLCEKMGWVPGDLLRVSPRADRDFVLVGDNDVDRKIDSNEIVVYLGPDDSDVEGCYFYLMTQRGERFVGFRQDFTRVGNVKV